MSTTTHSITAGFIDQCERTLTGGVPLSDDDRLRLFRLAGHTEEAPNCIAYWPSVWNMIDDARSGVAQDRAPLSYDRAVQIMVQSTNGATARDGLPSVYVDQHRRCFVYRENVIQAMQMAATFAWDNVVMPGTSLHQNYKLLLHLSRGEATPQEQLEAAVLIRGLLGDK